MSIEGQVPSVSNTQINNKRNKTFLFKKSLLFFIKKREKFSLKLDLNLLCITGFTILFTRVVIQLITSRLWS